MATQTTHTRRKLPRLTRRQLDDPQSVDLPPSLEPWDRDLDAVLNAIGKQLAFNAQCAAVGA